MSAWLTSSQIAEVFAEEVVDAAGTVTSSFDKGDRLFARGVLPPSIAVAPRDHLKGGVALCATDSAIFVHPYVFRIVCTNGAVMAQATQTHQLQRDGYAIDLETSIREAIRCCCDREAFVAAADQMRFARRTAADMAITMSAWMSSHQGAMWEPLLAEIFRRYEQEADRSAYGLMNAVTSVARDTRDPQTKWRLEEFGGSIPAMLRKPIVPRERGRAIERSLVEVG